MSDQQNTQNPVEETLEQKRARWAAGPEKKQTPEGGAPIVRPNRAGGMLANESLQFEDAAVKFVSSDTSNPNYQTVRRHPEKGRIRVGRFVLVSALRGVSISEIKDDGTEMRLSGSLDQTLAHVVETLAAEEQAQANSKPAEKKSAK